MDTLKMRVVKPMVYDGKEYAVGEIVEIGRSYLERGAKHFQEQGMAIPVTDELAQEIQQQEKGLCIINARELMRRKKDTRYIIQDFLLPKTVNMLYSPPGGYKSLLMLDACLSIAVGEPWMGLKTKQGRVLILDKEMSESELRNRTVAIVNGHKWQRRRNIINLNLLIRQGSLDDKVFVEQLHEIIEEQEVRLLVLDTLRRFGNFEENSSDSINRLYEAFQRIINGTDCAVLFLHHANKEGDSYRGSVDLLGQVDTAYRLRRKRNPYEFILECEKSRSGEIEAIAGVVEWNKDKEITTITREDVKEQEKSDAYEKFRKVRSWVLRELEELTPMAGNTFMRGELLKHMQAANIDLEPAEQMSRAMMDKILVNLCQRKYLVKTGIKGEYRRIFTLNMGVPTPQGGKDGV